MPGKDDVRTGVTGSKVEGDDELERVGDDNPERVGEEAGCSCESTELRRTDGAEPTELADPRQPTDALLARLPANVGRREVRAGMAEGALADLFVGAPPRGLLVDGLVDLLNDGLFTAVSELAFPATCAACRSPKSEVRFSPRAPVSRATDAARSSAEFLPSVEPRSSAGSRSSQDARPAAVSRSVDLSPCTSAVDVRSTVGPRTAAVFRSFPPFPFSLPSLSRSHSNYLAQISIEMTDANNQINDVLSKLTALGTVLIPMNLVTGLWGMNVHVPGQDIEVSV